MIKTYIADLKAEFSGYSKSDLAHDMMAGGSVVAVALPLALAVGVSSGAGAAAGMVTAIVAGLLIGLLSGASYQVSGTAGSMLGILTVLSYQYGPQGIFVASVLSGIMLLLAGIFKFGRIVEFIPAPVVTGFTSGIAVIIAFGEFDTFFGVTVEGTNVLHQAINIAGGLAGGTLSINTHDMLIGLMVLFILIFWPRRWGKKVPGALVGIVLALIINLIAELDVSTIGALPKTILLSSHLSLSEIDLDMIGNLIVPAFSIAVLTMLESLMCGVAGGRMKGESLNGDRELVAHGIGDIILPLLGGIPATAGLARTTAAITAGARTRLTTMFHGLFLLLIMLLLGPVIAQIPMAALSAVLIMVGIRMNDWATIRYFFGQKIHSAILSFMITLLFTVVFDLTIAIAAGVVLSCFFFILRVANIDINISDINYDLLEKHGIKISDPTRKIKVIYMSGPIFFAAIDKIYNRLENLDNLDMIIFSMRGVPMVDTSGGQALLELCEQYREQNIRLMFAGVQPKVMRMFKIDGILDFVGEENFFWDTEAAIKKYQKLISPQAEAESKAQASDKLSRKAKDSSEQSSADDSEDSSR